MMKRSYFIPPIVFIMILIAWGMSADSAENVAIHGFISQGYLKTDQNNYLAETDDGSFQFNEMGINFTTFVSDDLKIGCQFFARDLGDVGNDKIIVNWAFAEYAFKNWLNLRAGIIKNPNGFYSDLRDFDSLRTSIFLPSSIYNEWQRDASDKVKGIELFGALELGMLGIVEYQLITGNGHIDPDSGMIKFLLESGGLSRITKIESEQGYCSRLLWETPLEGVRLGCSYRAFNLLYNALIRPESVFVPLPVPSEQEIPITIDIEKSETYAFSAEYIYHNLKITFENLWTFADISSTTLSGAFRIDQRHDTNTRNSYYVSIDYRFNNWLGAAFYYSDYTNVEYGTGDDNELKDQCLSFRFDFNPNWILKVEAHVMDGKFGVAPDDDGHTYSEWLLFAAKMSYSF